MCLHRRHRAHSISSKMPQTWSDEYFHRVFFGVLEDVGLLVGMVVPHSPPKKIPLCVIPLYPVYPLVEHVNICHFLYC